MKNLIFSFITLLIFLHTATQAHGQKHDVVVDWDGNALLSGEMYYVLPVSQGPKLGGGVVPYAVSKVNCTYGVSQLLYGAGNPVTFSSNLGDPIRERTDLNISFASPINCGPSDVWKRGDNATGQYFVMIGAERKPGYGIIPDAFQIIKVAGDYYKFVFCPATCLGPLCPRVCEDVGIILHDGVRRLVVSNSGGTPYHIRFSKYLKPQLARY